MENYPYDTGKAIGEISDRELVRFECNLYSTVYICDIFGTIIRRVCML